MGLAARIWGYTTLKPIPSKRLRLNHKIYFFAVGFLAWQYRDLDTNPIGTPLSKWARLYLLAQGIVATVLGLVLLFAPNFMASVGPRKITRLLAQLYSTPFWSYGIGSLLLARRQTWREVRIPVTATLVFAVGVLIASIFHRRLFSAADLSDRLWFIGFTLASLMLGLLSVAPLHPRGPEHF